MARNEVHKMTRKYYLTALLLLAAATVATVIAYPQLPDYVPTHWNIQNKSTATVQSGRCFCSARD
jgi:uncharacterized membrane protein